MKIGPEMSELCSSQICGSNMETDVTMTKYGNCDTEYLEPQIEISIAHSILHRFSWKKMCWSQNIKGYKLNTKKIRTKPVSPSKSPIQRQFLTCGANLNDF